MLSDRADDDERAAEAWAALERALAGTILLGPCDTSQAEAIGALASDARARDVVNWLAALYPPPGGEPGLGAVQPDRLAELLLGPILTRQAGLLGQVGALANEVSDAYAVLFTLVRTAAHPDFSQVGEQTSELIASHPEPLAWPRQSWRQSSRCPPRCGTGSSASGDKTLEHSDAGDTGLTSCPRILSAGRPFSAALTTVITGILRPLADAPRRLPPRPRRVAEQPRHPAGRGGAAGGRPGRRPGSSQHLPPARRGQPRRLPPRPGHVAEQSRQPAGRGRAAGGGPSRRPGSRRHLRQLAADNPDAYLPDLAASLNNLGNRLAEAGQREEALAPAQEAVTIRRQLAAGQPRRLPPRPGQLAEQPRQPAGGGRAAAGGPRPRPGSRQHLPAARRGQPGGLPP